MSAARVGRRSAPAGRRGGRRRRPSTAVVEPCVGYARPRRRGGRGPRAARAGGPRGAAVRARLDAAAASAAAAAAAASAAIGVEVGDVLDDQALEGRAGPRPATRLGTSARRRLRGGWAPRSASRRRRRSGRRRRRLGRRRRRRRRVLDVGSSSTRRRLVAAASLVARPRARGLGGHRLVDLGRRQDEQRWRCRRVGRWSSRSPAGAGRASSATRRRRAMVGLARGVAGPAQALAVKSTCPTRSRGRGDVGERGASSIVDGAARSRRGLRSRMAAARPRRAPGRPVDCRSTPRRLARSSRRAVVSPGVDGLVVCRLSPVAVGVAESGRRASP